MIKIISGILLLLMLTGCSKCATNRQDTDPPQTTSSGSQNEDTVLNSEQDEKEEYSDAKDSEETTEIKDSKPVAVEIKDSSGRTSVVTYDSAGDIALERPDWLNANEMFAGWQETEMIGKISDNAEQAMENITLTAESIYIADIQNAIYNDAVYLNTDESTDFSVGVNIGGQAEFCILDLEIEYDPKAIAFSSIENADADAICNCVTEENKIYISFVSTQNIDAEVKLCDINFKAIGKEKNETELFYTVTDIAGWDAEEYQFYDVDFSVIPGRIVMY